MSQPFDRIDRQRSWLTWCAGILMAALCAATVVMSWSSSGVEVDFSLDRRWPTLIGLSGMVMLFVLYVQHKHKQLADIEAKLRLYAVREATLQARFSELSFLFDISTQLQLRLDLPSMLDLATQRLMPCLDAHQASIMLHNPETGMLEVKAAAGTDAGMILGSRQKPGEGISGTVFQTGTTQILTPEVMEKQFPDQVKRGRSITAGLCVPMRFRGEPIGVVSVARTSGEAFGTLHAKMLETFADHCAATVVKTHHHHELLRQVTKAA
jgi:transcriptional regulator with GAF, ATPase, and Fis domain